MLRDSASDPEKETFIGCGRKFKDEVVLAFPALDEPLEDMVVTSTVDFDEALPSIRMDFLF